MSTTPTTNPSNKTLFMLLGVGGGIILLCSGLLVTTLLVMKWGGNPKKIDEEISGKPNKGRPNSGAYKGPESNTLTASEAAQGFMEDIRTGRVGDAYDRTTDIYRSQTSQQEFSTLIDKNPGLIKYVDRTMTSSQSSESSTVSFKGKVSGGPNGTVNFVLEVKMTDNGYRISKFSIQ